MAFARLRVKDGKLLTTQLQIQDQDSKVSFN